MEAEIAESKRQLQQQLDKHRQNVNLGSSGTQQPQENKSSDSLLGSHHSKHDNLSSSPTRYSPTFSRSSRSVESDNASVPLDTVTLQSI